jgi:type IV secretion system protein TrbL
LSSILADVGIGPISIPTPGDLVTALKNAVVEVADKVFEKIIEWIAGLLADAVSKVTEALVILLRAIKPTITPGGTITNAADIQRSVLGLAASLLVAFYLFRIIHGVITGQDGQSMRATIVDLPMVVVGTMGFGFLCYTLLSVIDAFSDPMIDGFATTLNDTVTKLYSQEGLVKGGLFVFIFAVLYIAAAIFLCFELFVRSSLIYLVIMFAPLAIATRIWGPTRNYARRATETAVALIFAKLAIAVTLATGASLMNTASTSGGTVEMIQGSAILLLAAFMPFALMRVIPIMEGAVAGEGVARNMGTKAAVAGYGATKAASAATAPVSSAAGAIKAKWDGRQSSSGTTGGDGGGSSGNGAVSSPAGGGTKPGGPTPAGSPSSPGAPSSATEAPSEAGASSKPDPEAKSTPSSSPSKPTVEDTSGGPPKSQPSQPSTGTATAGQSQSSVSGSPSRPTQQAAPPSSTPLGTTRNQQRSGPPTSAAARAPEVQQNAEQSRTQTTQRVPVPQTLAKPAQPPSKKPKP